MLQTIFLYRKLQFCGLLSHFKLTLNWTFHLVLHSFPLEKFEFIIFSISQVILRKIRRKFELMYYDWRQVKFEFHTENCNLYRRFSSFNWKVKGECTFETNFINSMYRFTVFTLSRRS